MRKSVAIAMVSIALAFILIPDLAFAATGGGGLPWDTGLQTLEQDMTGPVPFMIGMVGFVCGLIVLVFAHEMNAFGRSMVLLVMVVSAACAVPRLAAALGIAGAILS